VLPIVSRMESWMGGMVGSLQGTVSAIHPRVTECGAGDNIAKETRSTF
jgi:hypothetical protein